MPSRRRQKRPPVRTRPVEAIAAIADRNVIQFLTVRLISRPDGEQAKHQTLVPGRVEVVKLRLDVQIETAGVQTVRHLPQRRGQEPPGAVRHAGEFLVGLESRHAREVAAFPITAQPSDIATKLLWRLALYLKLDYARG